MKFIQEITPKGFLLSITAMKAGGFKAGQQAEYRIQDNVIVVLKRQMNAMELLNVAAALQELSVELYLHLVDACDPCEGCEGGCPYADEENQAGIDLPVWLRREAGISEEAKLCVEVNAESSTVMISEAGYRYDLRDLPPDIVEMFSDAGACLEELDKHLITEDTVYGG